MGFRVPTCAVAGVRVPQTVCPRVPCLTWPETDGNSRPPSHPPFLPSPNISPHPPPSYSHSCLHHFPGGGGGHNRDTQPVMPLPPHHTSDPPPPLHIVSLPSGSLDHGHARPGRPLRPRYLCAITSPAPSGGTPSSNFIPRS